MSTHPRRIERARVATAVDTVTRQVHYYTLGGAR